MDYISREEILAEYDRQHKGPSGGARKMIETWPAADVASVVRCKDCIERFLLNGNKTEMTTRSN